MNRHLRSKSPAIYASLVLLLVAGCSSQPVQRNYPEFTPVDLNAKVQSGELIAKTDNFLVIMDASSSMNADYEGVFYPGPTKFDVEKDVVNRLNQSIPDLDVNAGIMTFGSLACLDDNTTVVKQPVSAYSEQDFAKGLDSITCASGITPMNEAMDSAISILSSSPGSVSFILISDGEVDDYTDMKLAKGIRNRFGDESCLYTIFVGDDPDGKAYLASLAETTQCGFVVTAEEIAAGPEMAAFVENALLTENRDGDGDGVSDSDDKCLATPKGVKVNEYGCWVGGRVLFDFDQDSIKPEVYPLLNELAAALKNLPQVKIEIEGHTDNIGDREYNIGLSKRRADAIKNYLVAQKVNHEQLITDGVGPDDPLYSNETAAGRARNRRVQLNVIPYR